MLEKETFIGQSGKLGVQSKSLLNPSERWRAWDSAVDWSNLPPRKRSLAEAIEFELMEISCQELQIKGQVDQESLRAVSYMFLWLKRNRSSYGTYVINFALPSSSENFLNREVKIPRSLPEFIWKMAPNLNKEGLSVPMARVDAIRDRKNQIKIIEVNYSWVDNLWLLQASQEAFGILVPQKPIDCFINSLRDIWGKNIGLAYLNQTDGCLKEDMAGLKTAFEKSRKFAEVIIFPLREIDFDPQTGKVIIPKSKNQRIPVDAIYLNGDQNQAQGLAETSGFETLMRATAQQKILLVPTQNPDADNKNALANAFAANPTDNNLVAPTFSVDAQNTRGPNYFGLSDWEKLFINPNAKNGLVLKPAVSQSLKGVIVGTTVSPEEWRVRLLEALSRPETFVIQKYLQYLAELTLAFDTKTKEAKTLESPFEKLNIWVLRDQILGVIATYGETPKINDAGFNLPVSWRFV